MLKLLVPALLALTVPAMGVARGTPAGVAQEDAARLVPSETRVLVRLESLDALLDLVHAFGPVAGEPVASLDAATLLGGLQLPIDAAAVDTQRAVFLAVSIVPGAQEPGLTWVVPMRSGAALPASPPGLTIVGAGGYAGVSTQPGYAAGTAASPLVAKLARGLLSVHVDVAALLAVYRPLVDMGLQHAEMTLDAMPDDSPVDIVPLVETYFAGLRSFLDSAETFDLGLARHGDELAFVGGFTARKGSALDGWESPRRTDLEALAGHLQPGGTLLAVGALEWPAFLARFQGFYDAIVQVYPEPLRSDLELVLASQQKVLPLLEPGIAVRADFGPAGIEATYLVRSKRPAELLTAMDEALRPFVREKGFLRLGAPARTKQDGLEVRTWDMALDWQAVLDELPGATATAPADLERMQGMLESVYGEDLRIALVAEGETLLVVLGRRDASLQAAIAGLRAPGALAPELARLIERSGGGTPSFAYRIDFGPAMRHMMQAMEPLMPEPITWPDVPFGLDVWGSIRGPAWSGGLAVDLDQLLRFVPAMQALETK